MFIIEIVINVRKKIVRKIFFIGMQLEVKINTLKADDGNSLQA